MENIIGPIARADTIALPNQAPEWTSTPAPTWIEGVGGTYDLKDDTFDAEGDALTYTLGGGGNLLLHSEELEDPVWTPTRVTVTDNSLAWSGGVTPFLSKVEHVSAGTKLLVYDTTGLSVDAGDKIYLSGYVKFGQGFNTLQVSLNVMTGTFVGAPPNNDAMTVQFDIVGLTANVGDYSIDSAGISLVSDNVLHWWALSNELSVGDASFGFTLFCNVDESTSFGVAGDHIYYSGVQAVIGTKTMPVGGFPYVKTTTSVVGGSTALPANVTLNPNGVLTATSSVTVGDTTGILFDVVDTDNPTPVTSSSVTISIEAVDAVADPDWIIPASFNYSADGYWDGDAPSATVLTHAQAGQTSVSAGDIIQLAAGNRAPIRMRNIHGASGNRVVIRSDPAGITTMARPSASSGGFVFWIKNMTDADFDGSYTTGEDYGIKITSTASGDAPSTYLQLTGICQDYTIRNVEIDGAYPATSAGGIGIQQNDGTVTEAQQPWRENIIVEYCKIYDVEGEGIYLGPNYGSPASNSVPMRTVEVRYCDIQRTGRDGINVKSTLEGTNVIHHNYIKTTGTRTDETEAGQKAGIAYFEGSGTAHSNWIEDAGEAGIASTTLYRPSSFSMPAYICYNNVIINAGAIDTAIAQSGSGITSFRPSSSFAQPASMSAYNNTIINVENNGVACANLSVNVTVQNNIISGFGASATSIGTSGTSVTTFNETGSVASQNFVSGVDYHLTSSSPARNAATAGLVAATDYDGNSRPLGADEDRGAYEYIE